MTLGAKIKKTELLIIKTKKELDHLPKNIGSNLILKAIPTNRTRRARAISRQNPADFAHTMFELRPRNTANFHFRPKRRERGVVPKSASGRNADSKDAGTTVPSRGRGNFQQKIICDRIPPSLNLRVITKKIKT